MVLNKVTFCLASLVVILAFVFVAPHVFADDFTTELSIEDVSFADKSFPGGQDHDIQVQFNMDTRVYVKFDKVVDYRGGNPNNLNGENFNDFEDTGVFTHHDVVVLIYNEIGQVFVTRSGADEVVIEPRDPNRHDGKNYTITFNTSEPNSRIENHNRVLVYIKQGSVTAVDPAIAEADSKNAEGSVAFDLVFSDGQSVATDGLLYPNSDRNREPVVNNPAVYGISTTALRARVGVTEPFEVKIRLSELPRAFTTDHIDVTNGKATELFPLGFLDITRESGADRDESIGYRPPTGGLLNRGGHLYYEYLVTIEPKFENKDDIVIKVKAFEDIAKPVPYKYEPPTSENEYVEGFDKLTVKVGKGTPKDAVGGIPISVPENTIIPKDGYLVVARSVAGSAVRGPGGADTSPVNTGRAPFAQTYNLVAGAIPNLESFLTNGGTIDVTGPKSLVITEIMWGSDASLKDADASAPSNSQWIELKNTSGAEIKAAADAYKLIFYAPNETPPAKTAAVAATATTLAVPAALPAGVTDRVGTITDAGAYWSIAGKGQSGRTGQGEGAAALTAVVQTQAIISMYRVADATDKLMDGNTAAAWTQSTPPSLNFDPNKIGVRIGSPGRDRLLTAADEAAAIAADAAKVTADAAAAAKAADTSVSMPKVGQIYISEVMFAGGGTLPQWIEIANGSRSEQVDLSGWTLTVENATADADVSVGAKAVFTIPEGTKVDPSGQNDTPSTLLVVTEQGRNNLDGAMAAGQILNLWTDQQTELILLGVTKRRYSLLSDMAFQITLAPPVPIVAPAAATPAPTTAAGIAAARTAAAAKKAADATAALARKQATDVVGNLGTAGTATWALPMDEGARSSIIRRHVQVSIGAAEPEDGMMMDSWALASDTSFAQITHIRASSYYGSADDVGTPGFRAGGALPVELSHFRPARDKVTDAVVITWSTQSELNNAGFFIKRSQQRDGQFQIINATMIQGAGTTSEKQFYTYEDTTAQPNVVYYYQIEDVSLDGNRQTLTNGIRLKGHVGAAGKLTTMWGDLKTQE